MADIPEFHLLKPNTFSDGTDRYMGVKAINWEDVPLPTVGQPRENQLRPDRLEEVESNGPAVRGRVVLAGPNASALVGTTIASATMQFRDIVTAAGAKTLTLTNMLIKAESAGANRTTLQDATYQWEATAKSLT